MSEPKPKFKVAEIAVDADGFMWLIYIGQQPAQGGIEYGWGSVGFQSERDLGNGVAATFLREMPEYMRKINEKTEAKKETSDEGRVPGGDGTTEASSP